MEIFFCSVSLFIPVIPAKREFAESSSSLSDPSCNFLFGSDYPFPLTSYSCFMAGMLQRLPDTVGAGWACVLFAWIPWWLPHIVRPTPPISNAVLFPSEWENKTVQRIIVAAVELSRPPVLLSPGGADRQIPTWPSHRCRFSGISFSCVQRLPLMLTRLSTTL